MRKKTKRIQISDDEVERVIQTVKYNPVKIAHDLGFTLLTPLHNKWMVDMFNSVEDETLQAHRGSYKTTCVSVVLALLIVCKPNVKIAFFRKTDRDVRDIIGQIEKILHSDTMQYIVYVLWGKEIRFIRESGTEILTNLPDDPRGGAQLVGLGIGGSITGKHYDLIFTDDIVNVNDRTSKTERERTRLFYQELQNIKNREYGCKIVNTGTPWHPEDAFEIMPPAQKYDVYSTGLISPEEQAAIKSKMVPSLYAANYELRHIAGEDVVFTNPNLGADPALLLDCNCVHIDAAYGGQDYTAMTLCTKKDGKFYVYGKLWRKHVDDVTADILSIKDSFRAGRIYCENNGDKGYLAKALRGMGQTVTTYHEGMNKMLKISTFLKFNWDRVYFVQGTDEKYLQQILDYNEEADHDDAPDSLSSAIRVMAPKREEAYKSPFGG